jgi:glycosyltransferase involved in cell wall biosynthesis
MGSEQWNNSTAVGHWGEVVNGGGERVAWEMARTLDAPLYVGHRNQSIEPEDVDVRDLLADTASGWLVDRGGFLRMLGQQAGWGTAHNLRGYDALLTSGNECLAYVPGDDQPWVHYVHHTSRYATDRLPAIEEKHQERLGALKRRVEYGQRWMERQIYGRYSEKPTLLVANSEPVARRIQTYWGIPSEDIRVVYPPVPTEEYAPSDADTQDYYVTVSRLDWHKNIDEIVEGFTELGDEYELVVAGDGSERDQLEALAGENVTFEGYVSEERKRELLAGARGFVFAAQSEDFGIAPVEALAAGTPVLGVEEGFTQHQILDGQNGRLWTREDGDLAQTVREFNREGVAWTPREMAEFARLNFGRQRFQQDLQGVLAEARDRTELDVDLTRPVPPTEGGDVQVATDGGDE